MRISSYRFRRVGAAVRDLDEKKAALAQRMHASGESASTIAATLGVSRATVYRVLAEQDAETT